jgi:hypothetical protein
MGAFDFNRAIPGMIEPGEQKFLMDLARRNYWGAGEIVEIGSFVGLSTSALAEGLRLNDRVTNTHARIHVFDTFTFPTGPLEQIFRSAVGRERSLGAGFRDMFDQFLSPWSPLLDVHAGDATGAKWNGKPIEILFVDCAAGLDFHMAIAREFYPHLAVDGFLIHQDWFYNRSWYLPAIMRAHYPEIVPIKSVGTSRIFQRRSDQHYKIQNPSDHDIVRFLLDEIEGERDEPEHLTILATALIRFMRERAGQLTPAFQNNLLDALGVDQ